MTKRNPTPTGAVLVAIDTRLCGSARNAPKNERG